MRLVNMSLTSSSFYLLDRKSTRLNSSHSQISYAVFCLKKKKECVGQQRNDRGVERTRGSEQLVACGQAGDPEYQAWPESLRPAIPFLTTRVAEIALYCE